ncbi:hypothetical protein QIS74_04759 [Colletotrichum tabaci]|uniref:C2H2-type domain-containing protein n=1 Tax=Colletotrichum tabaci TaxID=1209068 RepID=A0AAV9THQ2_9PEZI
MELHPLTAAQQQRLNALGLCLNTPEPALICRLCGYALKPFGERASRHLAEKHDVPKSERRGLSGLVKSIGLPDPNDIPLRSDGLPPHPALTTVIGYACRHCDYRTASTDLISRHVALTHGFKDARKADGWQRDHIRSGLSLQSWSQNGSRGYWIAQPATATALQGPGRGTAENPLYQASAAQKALLAAAHDAERSHHLASRPAAVDSGPVDMAMETNWMRRTGWAEMFDGARRDILVAMSELPATAATAEGFPLGRDGEGNALTSSPEDEARLRRIISAVDGLMDRCEDTVRHTDVSMRCWLQSSEPHRPYKAPFELTGRLSTTRRYRRSLKRLLCFCIRLWRLPLGPRLSQCQRTLTVGQSRALRALWSDDIWTSVGPGGPGPIAPHRDGAADHTESSYEEDMNECDGSTTEESDAEDVQSEDAEGIQDLACASPDGRRSSHPVGDELQAGGDNAASQESTPASDHHIRTALGDLILRLLYFLVTEEFENGQSKSTLLVYFSGVLGL